MVLTVPLHDRLRMKFMVKGVPFPIPNDLYHSVADQIERKKLQRADEVARSIIEPLM
jgi:hypothetical protein